MLTGRCTEVRRLFEETFAISDIRQLASLIGLDPAQAPLTLEANALEFCDTRSTERKYPGLQLVWKSGFPIPQIRSRPSDRAEKGCGRDGTCSVDFLPKDDNLGEFNVYRV